LTKSGVTQEIPRLEDYSAQDFENAKWPAIQRYRALIARHSAHPTLPEQIRLQRHEAWLRCALATALERADAREVCEFWSDRADELILKAWTESGCAQSGYALLALGKLGSRELNLSSDVDLILVRSDDSILDTKAVRVFQTLLTDYSEFGFALRVDLTLRPGGQAAALVPSFSEFEYHYGYHGEPWERLAYVRMRILAGEASLVKQIRDFTLKFSYRRHLDFTLLDELKNLRTKIRHEKFETRPGAYHLKLGPGGIRELELFVHALQIIHGGRHDSLKTASTTQALLQIKKLSLLPADECDELLASYWSLRTLENRLHAYEDQQNYLVDLTKSHPALPAGFAIPLQQLTSRVSAIADSLFGPDSPESVLPADLDEQQKWLGANGFSERSLTETWPDLLAATAQSRRSEKDEEARLTFLKGFVATLAESGVDRDLGLSLLLDFVKGTRAKASFFTLLNRETRFRDDLARLFSISPYLGSLLASRPELVDEFIFRKQADPSADLEVLLEELAERRLLVELIASNQFLSDRDLDQLSENLTRSADGIVMDLLARLREEYGAPDVSLIAMGKWGGRELGLRSDLDFIFVTPQEPRPEDHKLARRFLARMTEAHRGGSIYAVDMRLRPSGNAGPILISQTSLDLYLKNEAAAWERQAYLRARPLEAISFSPAKSGGSKGLSPDDLAELAMIRAKLFNVAKPGDLDLKLTDGGLADVEFTAQIELLKRPELFTEMSIDPSTSGMIKTLETSDATWASIGSELRARYRFLRSLEQLFQLTTSQSGSKLRTKSDEFRRLALVMKCDPHELESQIIAQFQTITDLLKSVRKD
jgi:glutamate-ammonia-ligase adenylyltransferase